MKALMIIVAMLLALLLLSLIRVGGTVEYAAEGLRVRVRMGAVSFSVFPLREKKQKREKKKKQPKQGTEQAEEPPAKEGGSLALIKKFLPLVGQAAGRLRRKIRVDRLSLDFTAGAADPAAAAMAFGGANVALGMIWPILEHNFNIKERRIRTAVDFTIHSPVIYLFAAISLTVGQAVHLSFVLLFGAIKSDLQYRSEQKLDQKQKEAVSNVGK